MNNRSIADALSAFVNDSTQNQGLMIGGFPTGIGKTYQCCYMMLETVINDPEKRFIFITEQTKNVPDDVLENITKNEFGLSESDFDKYFMKIESNLDSFVTNYKEGLRFSAANLFEEYGKDTAIITDAVNDMYAYKNNKEHSDKLFRDSVTDRFRQSERKVRKAIREILKAFPNKEKRLNVIRNDEKFSWIEELYPIVRFDETPIIMMTDMKFMNEIDNLISPPFTIWLETDQSVKDEVVESRLKDHIIIIDEFDTYKKVMQSHIIEDKVKEVEALKSFRTLCSKLDDWSSLPHIMVTECDRWMRNRSDRYSFEQRFCKLAEEAEKIEKEYNTGFLFKAVQVTSEGYVSATDTSFLFKDYEPYSLGNTYTVETKTDERYNYILTGKGSYSRSRIAMMFTRIYDHFNRFSRLIRDLAFNYMYLCQDRGEEKPLQECVDSVLDTFDLDEGFHDYVKTKVLHNRLKTRSEKRRELPEPVMYSRGFTYLSMRDSANRMLQTHLYYTDYDLTPELILRHMCENTKVIGLSATGLIDSPASNFSLEYLRDVGIRMYRLPEEQKHSIERYIESNDNGFENGNAEVTVDVLPTDQPYHYGLWTELVGSEDSAEDIDRRISVSDESKNDSICKRYIRAGHALKAFAEDDGLQSMIAFFSAHIRNDEDSDFSRKNFSYIADLIAKNTGTSLRLVWNKDDIVHSGEEGADNTVTIVQITGDNYRTQTDMALKLLGNGEKVMLITAYNTLGAGQNLQYAIPKDKEKDLVWIRKDLPKGSSDEKDIDSVYLDDPSFIAPKIEHNDKKSLDGYLFYVSSMDASGQIAIAEKEEQIKRAFHVCYSPGYNITPSHFKTTPNYCLAKARILIQAVGRISRTGWKPKRTRIFVDPAIRDNGTFAMPLDWYGDFPGYIVKKLHNVLYSQQEEQPDRKLLLMGDAAVRVSHGFVSIMNDMRSALFGGDEEIIREWQKWREFVLRNPTGPEDVEGMDLFSRKAFKFAYATVPEPASGLWFTTKYDFKRDSTDGLKISFTKPRIKPKIGATEIWHQTSPEYSNLNLMLKIKGVREFMESKGYATEFRPDMRVMSPPLFRNIYMGALGEAVGKFLIERDTGLTLNEMDSTEYELFDYILDNGTFIDLKDWNHREFSDPEQTQNILIHIDDKLVRCGGDRVFVINVVTDGSHDYRPFNIHPLKSGGTVIEIPYLYKVNKNSIIPNTDAFSLLRKEARR